MSASTRMQPFPNGASFDRWGFNNCERCSKGFDDERGGANSPCSLENALMLAAGGNGLIRVEIAERIGLDGEGLAERCKEFHEEGTPPPVVDHPAQVVAFGEPRRAAGGGA